MTDINTVVIEGRLTKNAEFRQLAMEACQVAAVCQKMLDGVGR